MSEPALGLRGPTKDPLPKGLRNVALLAVVLGSVVGLTAFREALAVTDPAANSQMPPVAGFGISDPELLARLSQAELTAYLSAVEPMRGSRVAILFALALCSMLVFGTSLGLLRPGNQPREPKRRLLTAVPIAVAVFRVMDGAQMAVVARRIGHAMGTVMSTAEPYKSDPATVAALPEAFAGFATLVTAGLTFLMAGAFVAIAFYFRLPRVKEELARRDALLS